MLAEIHRLVALGRVRFTLKATHELAALELGLDEQDALHILSDLRVAELYVGTDGRIRELVFHHGGTMKPNLIIATWLDCKKAGPLLVSLDHRGTADGKPLRVYFSNVAVRLAGWSTWMEAH